MICVPLRITKAAPLIKAIKQAEKVGDLTEIWFDEIQDLDDKNLEKIFKTTKKPVLYKFMGDKTLLDQVLQFKPAYIDVDIATRKPLIQSIRHSSPKTKLIISFHDFDQTPANAKLHSIIKKMQTKGADIAKLATYAKDFTDAMRTLSILSEQKKPTIMISMGKHGQLTRSAGHLLGNYLMYAPADAASKTAPGQLTAKELRKIYQSCH